MSDATPRAGAEPPTIGPDLTGLAAKYDRAEVIRSVLEPSNRIATGYQPVIVATRDGKVETGVVRSETDTTLELADSEAKITQNPQVGHRRSPRGGCLHHAGESGRGALSSRVRRPRRLSAESQATEKPLHFAVPAATALMFRAPSAHNSPRPQNCVTASRPWYDWTYV